MLSPMEFSPSLVAAMLAAVALPYGRGDDQRQSPTVGVFSGPSSVPESPHGFMLMVRPTDLFVISLCLAVLAACNTMQAGAPPRTDVRSEADEGACTVEDGVETVCITTRGYIRVEGGYSSRAPGK